MLQKPTKQMPALDGSYFWRVGRLELPRELQRLIALRLMWPEIVMASVTHNPEVGGSNPPPRFEPRPRLDR